jgi:peptidoglycan-associated lipoprotein
VASLSRLRQLLLLATGVASLLLGGCAAPVRSYAILLDNPDGTVGAITVTGAKGQVLVNRSGHGATLDGVALPNVIEPKKLDMEFGTVLAARPRLPRSFLIFFDGTGIILTAESKVQISAMLEVLNGWPAPDVSIIGHTDTLGEVAFNEQLGMQRAHVVADFIAGSGIKLTDLTISSHGEFNLLVKTPDQTPEPKNRRVEITIR